MASKTDCWCESYVDWLIFLMVIAYIAIDVGIFLDGFFVDSIEKA